MDTPADTTPFAIDTTFTPVTVNVDGVDVSDAITGCTVHVGYGQATQLILHENRPGSIAATGLVTVAATASPADAVRNLDPQQVEDLAMSIDLDGGVMADAYLTAIVTMLAVAQ